ncbi:23S rRNA (guanosine(2251)-2'-O)-methyltransferase RlmB [Candidatus Poriferisodalis multihospitum]|uniref:23S rRNA (guanosine(2251)-2'-O)-methyltransferase RlmB n=1 Tax=Candidatus Poriferisodalis multihospitum TaxID=2983191 RepID=UPI002B259F37|nr:23S rRNA (guanosine(2251)-2'-O)-methyltransferase RlmB [Candidatus Poriferisodalis multihospitum]
MSAERGKRRGAAPQRGGRGAPPQRGERGTRASGRGSGGQQRTGSGNRSGAARGAANQAQAGRSQSRPKGLGGDHVEGRQAVRELLRAGKRTVHEVLISEDAHSAATLAEIVDLAGDRRVPVREVTRRKLDEAALTAAPQGVIAKAAAVQPVPLEELARPTGSTLPLVVATDGVTDPGNLGAILRTAEVAGATGVVLTSHRSANLTPAAAKAAAGAIEYLPIALVGGLPAALAKLRDAGLWTIGLDGHAPEGLESLRVGDEPLVLVLGAEGRGLSALVERRCDQVVSIPVLGRIESLNVAAAAAVALFDIARARAGDGNTARARNTP